jgi:hypothetical protein
MKFDSSSGIAWVGWKISSSGNDYTLFFGRIMCYDVEKE